MPVRPSHRARRHSHRAWCIEAGVERAGSVRVARVGVRGKRIRAQVDARHLLRTEGLLASVARSEHVGARHALVGGAFAAANRHQLALHARAVRQQQQVLRARRFANLGVGEAAGAADLVDQRDAADRHAPLIVLRHAHEQFAVRGQLLDPPLEFRTRRASAPWRDPAPRRSRQDPARPP